MNDSIIKKIHILPQFEDGMLFSKYEVRKLLKPVILETLLSYFIGLADSVMVSSAGEAAVSAVSLVDSISVLFINIFMALGAGGAVVCGQYLGKGDEKTSRKAAEQMTVLVLVISLVTTAAVMAFEEGIIYTLFGSAEKTVVDNCEIYYKIVMPSIPFIAIYNGGAALYRTTGDSRTPLKISIGMNVLNVMGNAILIYGFKMGVEGVAIPSLISRAAAMAAIIICLMRKSFRLNIRNIMHYRPERKLISDIVSIGVPGGIENGMFQFGKIVLMTLASTLPTKDITANAIGNSVGALHCVVGMAVNVSVTAVVSRCAGAHDFKQARWYVKYFAIYTILVQGIVNIVFIAAIPVILKLYGVSPETGKIAANIMLLHAVSTIILWPPSFMFNNAMRAAGDSQYAMIIASISMWVCRVAGAYVLVKGFNTGALGIWIAWDIDWLFRSMFFVTRYKQGKWETKAIT